MKCMRLRRRSFTVTSTILLCFALQIVGYGSQSEGLEDYDVNNLCFRESHLLYLQAKPCKSLYVEVDAVQGCEPKEESIEAFRKFLEEHCDKPGGIEIVRDDIVSIDKARVERDTLLALENMDGPGQLKDCNDVAYLYVLFYDSSRLMEDKRPIAPGGYVNMGHYPAAIFIDKRFSKKTHWQKERDTQTLLHEAGHVLGLTRNPAHKTKNTSHCMDISCLMYEKPQTHVSFLRMLTFQKQRVPKLCKLCEADLAKAKSNQANTKLQFMGPMLVRSEEGYHVLALPGFVRIDFGLLEKIQWEEVLAKAQKLGKEYALGRVMATGDITNAYELLLLEEAIKKAQKDPYVPLCSFVNEHKGELLEQVHQEILGNKRQSHQQIP